MQFEQEINRRYKPPPGVAGDQDLSSQGSRFYALTRDALKRLRQRTVNPVRLVFLPVLLVVGTAMLVYLKLYLALNRPRKSILHSKAVSNVDLLLKQYPFHLYPILCKCMELAHLQGELQVVLGKQERIVEIAIGEGSSSRLIFPGDAGVVGLEINPYYLQQTRQMKHVKEAIVCDCLEPPICEGSFDVIVANNFLHHVTQKAKTLAAWSRIAGKAVFNENTRFWASGWVTPYALSKLGLKTMAARVSSRIESAHWQHLLERSQLNAIVSESYEIVRSESYLSERTFFLCAVFSLLMRCTGPPTPAVLKRLFLGPLRWIALPMTKRLATSLIQYDELQDRSKDSFVSYTCNSRRFQRVDNVKYIMCPSCKHRLDGSNKCSNCTVEYLRVDGMLFLLPKELDHIRLNYRPSFAATVPGELL